VCKKYLKNASKEKMKLSFYFLLNHNIKLDTSLGKFRIKTVDQIDRPTVINKIEKVLTANTKLLRTLDFEKNEIYHFETDSQSIKIATENFYSTLHLYKGILEYSYHRLKWTYDFEQLIDNRKEFASFKYPLFIYITFTAEDFFNVYKMHEDYPYDQLDLIDYRGNKADSQFFNQVLNIFTKKNIDNGLLLILSDCFRLYGRGIDSPYLDQSFLYFWNVLEKITLSIAGSTEQVIKRIQTFFSEEFWEDNKNSIEYLRHIRNERVHKGKGEVDILDVNMLKYLCDKCILNLIGNPPGSNMPFKTTKHLEAYYAIKDNQNLSEIKEVIDFTINMNLNRKNKTDKFD
jgi:hypothetical protein